MRARWFTKILAGAFIRSTSAQASLPVFDTARARVTPGDEFNPNSIDAQLATLLSRMNGQDVYLRAIHTQTKLTNGRVTQHDKDLAARLGPPRIPLSVAYSA